MGSQPATFSFMNEKLNYAQVLRTIGQMLEALEIQSFALKIEASGLTISSQKLPQRETLPREQSLRIFWRRLSGKEKPLRLADKPSSGVLELHYTATDLARLDSEGQSKRGTTAATPEPHSVSQILRAVGGFVDQHGGQLLMVRKENQNVEFEYESKLKKNICKQYTVAGLYDYWVKMYLNRRDRSGKKN